MIKWLKIIINIINTVKPWVQDYVIPAIRTINAIKLMVREEGRDVRALLYRVFKNDAKVDKAINMLAIAIRVLDETSECFNQPTPMETIQCFMQAARKKDKRTQRHIWRSLAKSVIRQSTPGKQWDEHELNLAVEIAYAIDKKERKSKAIDITASIFSM